MISFKIYGVTDWTANGVTDWTANNDSTNIAQYLFRSKGNQVIKFG